LHINALYGLETFLYEITRYFDVESAVEIYDNQE